METSLHMTFASCDAPFFEEVDYCLGTCLFVDHDKHRHGHCTTPVPTWHAGFAHKMMWVPELAHLYVARFRNARILEVGSTRLLQPLIAFMFAFFCTCQQNIWKSHAKKICKQSAICWGVLARRAVGCYQTAPTNLPDLARLLSAVGNERIYTIFNTDVRRSTKRHRWDALADSANADF